MRKETLSFPHVVYHSPSYYCVVPSSLFHLSKSLLSCYHYFASYLKPDTSALTFSFLFLTFHLSRYPFPPSFILLCLFPSLRVHQLLLFTPAPTTHTCARLLPPLLPPFFCLTFFFVLIAVRRMIWCFRWKLEQNKI